MASRGRVTEAEFLGALNRYGVRVEGFDVLRASLKAKFGDKASDEDAAWAILNEGLLSPDQSARSKIRGALHDLIFMLQENNRPWRRISTMMHHYDLVSMSQAGVKFVTPFVGRHCCPACKALIGRRIPLPDAMTRGLLPVKGCSTENERGRRGNCRCVYNASFD